MVDDYRVIDAVEKRRRKTSDSKNTTSGSDTTSDKPKTIFTNFTSRLLSRRHKTKMRKEADELAASISSGASAQIRQKKPQSFPQTVVLYESDNCNDGVMRLIGFLDEKLLQHTRNDTAGSQTVNDIWKFAVEEFKTTLKSLLIQGHKDLLMSDLARNFEEGFDKQIEKQCGNTNEKKESFPKPLYMNSFRQILEEYVQERRTRPRAKTRPKKLEKSSGHHFQTHRRVI